MFFDLCDMINKRRTHNRLRAATYEQTTPLDTNMSTMRLEKTYFKLLQAIHHSEVVARAQTSGVFPPGMMRHVNKLTDFIKPSSPNDFTRDKVRQNTHQWMKINMNILGHHYDSVIASILEGLPPLEPQALQKAIAYGRTRYKQKLTQSSIHTLTSLTQRSQTEEAPRGLGVGSGEDWPPLGPPTYPPGDARSCLPPGLPRRIPRVGRSLRPAQSSTPNPNHSSPAVPQAHHRRVLDPNPPPLGEPNLDQSLTPDLNQAPQLVPQPNHPTISGGSPPPSPVPSCPPDSIPAPDTDGGPAPLLVPSTAPQFGAGTVAAGGSGLGGGRVVSVRAQVHVGHAGDEGEGMEEEEEQEEEGGDDGELGPTPPPHTTSCPQAQEKEESETLFEAEDLEDPFLCPNFDLGSLDDTEPWTEGEVEANKTLETNIEGLKTNALSNVAVLVSSGIEVGLSGGSAGRGEDPPGRGTTLTGPTDRGVPPTPEPAPRGPTRKPTRHPNAIQKIRTWSFQVTDPVVVVGDSNLSRISEHDFSSVQVESFPGAQIHHLKGVIAKLDVSVNTQKVVLSVGLNNLLRENQEETIKKQFQQLVALTQRRFPNAQIYLPLIQCSELLSRRTLILAKQINTFLQQHFTTLSMVDIHIFKVSERDLIHWTKNTALEIFKHWMRQLN